MSLLTNTSISIVLDTNFGLKVPTVVVSCTKNGTTSISVTNTNIPAAGYVSGTGISAGTTYTYTPGTVTLSVAASDSATNNLTFSIIPTTLYFALFTSAPNAAGGGTEVTGGSYARVAFANSTGNFPATSAQVKANAAAIQWPVSTGAWGTIVAWGAYDASTGGTLWFYGAITSVTMNSGDSIQFAIGQFSLTF